MTRRIGAGVGWLHNRAAHPYFGAWRPNMAWIVTAHSLEMAETPGVPDEGKSV